MVDTEFIRKFKEILVDLEKRGTVFLLAILKMDDATDKWTVVLSAEWLKTTTQLEAFSIIRSKLLDKLNEQERSTIARIGIFTEDDHLVEMMVDKHRADEYIDNVEKINGNLVHEGYVFAAQNPIRLRSS